MSRSEQAYNNSELLLSKKILVGQLSKKFEL